MKVLGITAEYNPLHRGHLYQLAKAKEITGAEYTVVCMSGNFVQRGEPAVLDKWTRAGLAADSANLVIELPFAYACNRAEYFASGAVNILAGMGVTHISFGCETGKFRIIEKIAELSIERKDELNSLITEYMTEGISHAKANELAVCRLLSDLSEGSSREMYVSQEDVSEVISGPNNILAIEYMKAIIKHNKDKRTITPVPIKRFAAGINDSNEKLGFAGATEIRRRIKAGEDIGSFVPEETLLTLKDIKAEDVIKRAFQYIRAEIVRSSAEKLSGIYCVGEGFENKLKKEVVAAESFEDLVARLTSKRYTSSTVRRILMYILLGVSSKEMVDLNEHLYGRILAADKSGREYLKILKKQELNTIPLITNINKDGANLNLDLDIRAGDMYNLLNERDLYDYSDRVLMPFIG